MQAEHSSSRVHRSLQRMQKTPRKHPERGKNSCRIATVCDRHSSNICTKLWPQIVLPGIVEEHMIRQDYRFILTVGFTLVGLKYAERSMACEREQKNPAVGF